MTPPSLYLKQEVSIKDLPPLGDKWSFIGIDMAPSDTLETGVAVLDRDRTLMRMDKLESNDAIIAYLHNLGPKQTLLIGLDVPKNLNIQGKWRQQRVKMHPLSLKTDESTHDSGLSSERFARRAIEFYDQLQAEGYFIFNTFTLHARMGYELTIPYRDRSPQGCRALQTLIRQQLQLKNLPTNLLPSSILDATVSAYAAWAVYKGTDREDYQFYQDDESRLYLCPLKRPVIKRTLRRRRSER